MEKSEVSIQETRFYKTLREAPGWMTAKALAETAQIARRSAGAYTLKFVQLGLADLAEVFPAHRYRWSAFAEKRNAAYVQRLERAREVFGL